MEQGAGGAPGPGTEGGKAGPAGGQVQAAAFPAERYETESDYRVLYRRRTICSVSTA